MTPEEAASTLTPQMRLAMTIWCDNATIRADVEDATKRGLVTRRLGAWGSGQCVHLTTLGRMVQDILLEAKAHREAVERRVAEFAAMCGLELDADEDPVTASDVRKAATDDVDLRAAIEWAPHALPKDLADYLARNWSIHVQAFDRVKEFSDLEIAAGWARRHAVAARAVLGMPRLEETG